MGGHEPPVFDLARLHARGEHAQALHVRRQPPRQQEHAPVRQQARRGVRRGGERLAAKGGKGGRGRPPGRRRDGLRRAAAAAHEQRGELPLARRGVRVEPPHRDGRKIRVRAQKMCDRLLVLLRRERAGGIDQPPAGAQRGGGAVEDGALPGRAGGHGRLRPVAHGLRLAAEHPLARARRVHEHRVERAGQRGAQRVRAHGRHHRAARAQPLQRAAQHPPRARGTPHWPRAARRFAAPRPAGPPCRPARRTGRAPLRRAAHPAAARASAPTAPACRKGPPDAPGDGRAAHPPAGKTRPPRPRSAPAARRAAARAPPARS